MTYNVFGGTLDLAQSTILLLSHWNKTRQKKKHLLYRYISLQKSLQWINSNRHICNISLKHI